MYIIFPLSIVTCLQGNIPWMNRTKKWWETLNSFKCDSVFDLKNEIMKEFKRQGYRSFEVTNYFIAESCEDREACPRWKRWGIWAVWKKGLHPHWRCWTEVLEKVINIIKEYEAETPESVLDRAHRIGPVYTGTDTGKKMQSIIVRFATFRHSTLFYTNR